jgi:hypothetical protein
VSSVNHVLFYLWLVLFKLVEFAGLWGFSFRIMIFS